MRQIITLITAVICMLAIPAAAQAGSEIIDHGWSGYYILPKDSYFKVVMTQTQFTVPKANCAKTKRKTNSFKAKQPFAKSGNGTAIWTGIDGAGGVAGNDVEQGGIYITCDKHSHPHYLGFWEMYKPSGSPDVASGPAEDPRALPKVYPGDVITVWVQTCASRCGYHISVTDGPSNGLGLASSVSRNADAHAWTRSETSTLNPQATKASGETIIEKGGTYPTAYDGPVQTTSTVWLSNLGLENPPSTCFECTGRQLLVPYSNDTPLSTSHRVSNPDLPQLGSVTLKHRGPVETEGPGITGQPTLNWGGVTGFSVFSQSITVS